MSGRAQQRAFDETPTSHRACSKCGALMVLINVDTGEPVEAASA